MSTLILLRHGQAAFGADNYDQLSDLGQRQAVATGAFWKARETKFSRVITGPRHRHVRTAELALRHIDHPVPQVHPLLDEFSEGSAILAAARARTGQDPPDRRARLQRYGEQIGDWSRGAAQMPGVPSAADFRARVAKCLQEITSSDTPSQNVLAVTSAGVIAAAAVELLGLPDSMMADLMRLIRNCAISEILFDARRRSLLSFNGASHRPPALLSLI